MPPPASRRRPRTGRRLVAVALHGDLTNNNDDNHIDTNNDTSNVNNHTNETTNSTHSNDDSNNNLRGADALLVRVEAEGHAGADRQLRPAPLEVLRVHV